MKNSPSPKILTNQNGSMSLLYSGLLILLIVISLYTVARNLESYRKIKERSKNYLCLKELLYQFEKYNHQMTKTNQVIFVNYFLQFNPKTGPVHKKIIDLTKIYQEGLTLNYHRKLLETKSCSLINKSSFSLYFLYQRNFTTLLARDQFERTVYNSLPKWLYVWHTLGKTHLNDRDNIIVEFLDPKDSLSKFRYQVHRNQILDLWGN